MKTLGLWALDVVWFAVAVFGFIRLLIYTTEQCGSAWTRGCRSV